MCLLAFISAGNGIAQSKPSLNSVDSLHYKACVASLPKGVPILLSDIAKYFVGSPYVANTLENNDTEQLTVNLRSFDCTTFVESCVAIYETVHTGFSAISNFSDQLKRIRYRDGWINGYPSRLHYMTDWIYQNEKKGILRNVSAELGGDTINKQINYMSTHPESYKHLNGNEENIEKIKSVEDNINSERNYIVIPKSKINKIEYQIKDGDIIVLASKTEGLDYSHIGIAYYYQGMMTFIHASSKAKEVVVEKQSLRQYINGQKKCSGISVLRMSDR